jgi:hypothetical protein
MNEKYPPSVGMFRVILFVLVVAIVAGIAFWAGRQQQPVVVQEQPDVVYVLDDWDGWNRPWGGWPWWGVGGGAGLSVIGGGGGYHRRPHHRPGGGGSRPSGGGRPGGGGSRPSGGPPSGGGRP